MSIYITLHYHQERERERRVINTRESIHRFELLIVSNAYIKNSKWSLTIYVPVTKAHETNDCIFSNQMYIYNSVRKTYNDHQVNEVLIFIDVYLNNHRYQE